MAITGGNPQRRTICRYCGVETVTGGSHSSERECVEALAAEVAKAKRLLGEAQHPAPARPPGQRRSGG
jgi:hypothetical protein